MAVISEIAPNIFRISIFAQLGNLQFNHFLVKDDEPLLFHTGLRGMHAEIREAVSKPSTFPSCATSASAISSQTSAARSMSGWLRAQCGCDLRPGWRARDGERLHRPRVTRPCRWRNLCDREVPFSLLPDSPSAPRLGRRRALRRNAENAALFGPVPSGGDVEPLTSADVVGRSHEALKEYEAGILAAYVPYTPLTAQNLKKLAALKPKTLAIMHGSSFTGDCARALSELDVALRDLFGPQQ